MIVKIMLLSGNPCFIKKLRREFCKEKHVAADLAWSVIGPAALAAQRRDPSGESAPADLTASFLTEFLERPRPLALL